MLKKTWKEFRESRFCIAEFFGVVTTDGKWVDSAIQFHTALNFACQYGGYGHLTAQMMMLKASELNVNIIHSSLLEKMYDAGLLK